MECKRHKHWQCIRAYADGWKIQHFTNGIWVLTGNPSFLEDIKYRIVPDEEGWLPFYATKDSEYPVDGDQMVEWENSKGHSSTTKAGGLLWNNGASPVVRYRIVKAEEVDPYAELKEAYTRGNVIQLEVFKDTWRDIIGEPAWTFPPEDYRIHPNTKTIKLLCYLGTRTGQLIWREEWVELTNDWVRVPSEDKTIEVENNV